ncbi:MAG: beta strand repeat-containing protein [Minwuia sp.]|uniref:beta strand repeat-containing protein n=1 Tax=Minwuia sp. TaxID=2493630 RepID=UPI003A842820
MGLFRRKKPTARVSGGRLRARAEIEPPIQPLEPRIMLDATLDLDPGITDTIDLFHAVFGAVDAQRQQALGEFQQFTDDLNAQVAFVAPLLDIAGDTFDLQNPNLDPNNTPDNTADDITVAQAASASADAAFGDNLFGFVEQTVNRIVAELESNLDQFIADETASLLSAFNAQVAGIDFGGGATVGNSFVEAADLSALFTFDNLTSADDFVTGVGDVFRADLQAGLGGAFDEGDVTTLANGLSGVFVTQTAGSLGDLFSITLADIDDPTSDDPADLAVAFSGGGATVNVQVTLPEMTFDLDSLLEEGDFGLSRADIDNAVSFSVQPSFTFDLVVDPANTGGGDSEFSLSANNFAAPQLLTVGGDVFDPDPDNPVETRFGFLDVTLTDVRTAEFTIDITGLDSIDFSAVIDFDAANPAISFAGNVAGVGVGAFVTPVGGVQTAITNEATFNLLRVDVDGALNTQDDDGELVAADFEPENQSAIEFTASATFTSLLSTAGDDFLTAFLNAADIGAGFDVTTGGLDAGVEAALESFVGQLAATSSADVANFLSQLGDNLEEVAAAAIFDIDLPFTDLKLLDAFQTVVSFGEQLADLFTFQLNDIGLGSSIAISGANTVTGTALDFASGAVLDGFPQLSFIVSQGDIDTSIRVLSPNENGGFASISELVDAFNTALAGTNAVASADGDALAFALVDAGGDSVTISVNPAEAAAALTVSGLVTWVNGRLADIVPDGRVILTQQGEILFRLPEIGGTVDIGDPGDFSAADLGFGIADSLSLSADLTASATATLNGVFGFDVAGFISELADDLGNDAQDTGSVLTERAQNGGSLGAAASPAAGGVDLADHASFRDVELFGRITATAASISGTADLGIVSATFGANDAAQNSISVDAQVNVTLVERQNDGSFDSTLTFTQIATALTDQDGRPQDLLGRFELQGGLIVDEDAALQRQEANVFAAAPGEGEIAAIALVALNDVTIDVTGLSGIAADALNGVRIASPDIFDTTTWIVAIDSPIAETLTSIQGNDILDTATNIAGVLVELGESLSQDFALLDTPIPLLNVSLLDSVDFAEDFLQAAQEARNNPEQTLGRLDTILEQAFGDDTVELSWDTGLQTLTMALSLSFLDDVESTTPFSFDLGQLLGDSLATVLGAEVAEFVSGLVDVKGDAALTFDPDLLLDFTIGIDLSGVLGAGGAVDGATLLSALSSVAAIANAPGTGNELRITRLNKTDGGRSTVSIDFSDLTDIDSVVTAIGDAFAANTAFANASVSFDAEAGTFIVEDTQADARDTAGADLVFGGELEAADAQTGAVDLGGVDLTGAISFDLVFNDGDPVTVSLEADAARNTPAAFVDALNAAFRDIDVARADITPTAMPTSTVPLSQLIVAALDGHALTLTQTNFTAANGFDDATFAVQGNDASQDIQFRFDDLGGSNASQLIGFTDGLAVDASGGVVSETLGTAGSARVFLDVENTGIELQLTAGVAEGLNVQVAMGPFSVNIVDGTALLGSGAGDGTPGSMRFGILDIDGDDNDGQYDLGDLADLFGNPDRSLLELFSFTTAFGISIDLPLSDTTGLFDPATDGITFNAGLLNTVEGADFSSFDIDNVGDFFDGALVDIFVDGSINLDDIEINLPDLADALANINVLDILNDPRLVLGGLDTIVSNVSSAVGAFLDAISLPIIGDNLGAGLSVLDQLRFDIIQPALDFASQPDDDGNLPTTVDLLTGFVNDAMNDLFETDGVTYLQAFLDTSGSTEESFLYGAFSFTGELFREALDIGFDFGIPGLEFEVSDSSAIVLAATYTANIGFGIDRRGLFFLNDTDETEISIDFIVDAGDFEGSFTVAQLLELTAFAVEDPLDLPENTFAQRPDFEGGESGDLSLTASLGVDLFQDQGEDEERDLSGITVQKNGEDIGYEKSVLIGQLKFAELAGISFTAEADVNLQLIAEVIDPTTGNPITVNGAEIVPKAVTELVIDASFDTARDGDKFSLDTFMFNDLRVDASGIFDTYIRPITDPIEPILDPFQAIAEITNTFPISLALGALEEIYPVLAIPNTIINILGALGDLQDQLQDSGGFISFGDFDFSGSGEDLASGETSSSDLELDEAQRSDTGSVQSNGQFGGAGLQINLPILSDPTNIFSLILGNFDEVDLVEATFTLIDFDFEFDLVRDLLAAVSMPEELADALGSFLTAELKARAFAGFTVGYDLGGVSNFLNTLDPERLLDGIFIDSSDGGLIDLFFGANIRASIDISVLGTGIEAGASGGGEIFFTMGFNDPNNDDKLRVPEIIRIGEVVGDLFSEGEFIEAIETMFKGTAGFSLFAEVFGKVKAFGATIFSGTIELFSISESISFGGLPLPVEFAPELSGSGAAVLNVGARVGQSFSDATQDGDEIITITGPNSPFDINYQNGNVTNTGQIDDAATALIIPAGIGNNVIDLSGIVDNTPTFITTGAGADRITLPNQGFHVVFAGDGADNIQVDGAATGTYYIFGEGGADTIEIDGGNTVIFGSDSFGMARAFTAQFGSGANTFDQAAVDAFLATQLGDFEQSLADMTTNYTAQTQDVADNAADVIRVASGFNHRIFAGAGDDLIEITGTTDTGNVTVLGGAGTDTITARGADVFVEGGAGSDIIVLGDGTNRAFGWGAQADEGGLGSNERLNALVLQDGGDLIIGGAGTDTLVGQTGDDILQGGLGADSVRGGLEDDILTGGIFDIETRAGADIDLVTANLHVNQTQTLIVKTLDVADGNDILIGDGGLDVALGGGGNDNLNGGAGNDLLAGDFGQIQLSSNKVAQQFTAIDVNSTNAGPDTLDGGDANDLLVAGGTDAAGTVEILNDTLGQNIFIGDYANVDGARILEAPTDIVSVDATLRGGADSITGGRGNEFAIGGEGSDTISIGNGVNRVIGDNGAIDINGTSLTSASYAFGSDDVITAGSNIDMIVGGSGSDTISAGDGDNMILADIGLIDHTGTFSAETLSADSDVDGRDGNDSVTSGSGNDFVILGGANDTLGAGDGNNRVLGDSGLIEVTGTRMTTASDAQAGQDQITTGSGIDLIAGGSDNDTISAGDGDNLILADIGLIDHDRDLAADTLSADSDANGRDGDDSVTSGTGNDFIILGGKNDTLGGGEGNNRVLGDSGLIDVTNRQMRTDNDDQGGQDNIVTGAGIDFVLSGSDNDTLNTGDGDNLILTDTGTLNHAADLSLVDMTSAFQELDGADSLTSGSGRDYVIMGGAGDIANIGDGDNRLLGDSGVMDPLETGTSGRMVSTDFDRGGNDTIDSGSGRDFIFGGFGQDTIRSTDGDDLVVGNSAVLLHTPVVTENIRLQIQSLSPAIGDADLLISTGGDDVLMGGTANDTLSSGADEDIAVGDWMRIDFPDFTGADGLIRPTDQAVQGRDSIDLGTDNDIAFGNGLEDTINTGSGEDVAVGDFAELDFVNNTDTNRLVLTDHTLGANDLIVGSGFGDNIMVGQIGNDTMIGGADENLMVGDVAILRFVNFADVVVGQSANDRLTLIESIQPGIRGNDRMIGGGDRDVMLGGFGADFFEGRAGQDIIMGDGFIVEIEQDGRPGFNGVRLPQDGEVRLSTNFAFLDGGRDTLIGGLDPDVLIGGLGPDDFVGDTANDFLAGDSAFFRLLGTQNTDRGTGDPAVDGLSTPAFLRVIQSNFPGLGANDLVSDAQINESTSSTLSIRKADFGSQQRSAGGGALEFERGLFDGGQLQTDQDVRTLAREIARAAREASTHLSEFVSGNDFLEDLAASIELGVQSDIAVESYRRDAIMSIFGGRVPTTMETYMVEKMLDEALPRIISESVPGTAPDGGAEPAQPSENEEPPVDGAPPPVEAEAPLAAVN